MSKLTIYLDSGHYPEQPGKRSPKLPDGRRFFEWEANYKICTEIMRMAEAEKLTYIHYLIKPQMAEARSIERRAIHYNHLTPKRPGDALIVSVHSNAAGNGANWHPAHGIETYYWHTSRIGAACATVFQNHLVRSFGWMDRGVKPTSTLGLLRMCNAPVILTETGFFTNEDQVQQMLKPEYITTAAAAHYAAIKELHEHAQDGKIF